MFKDKKNRVGEAGVRQRRKKSLRRYGQAQFRQSRMGIVSCCYAAAGAVLLLASVTNAFLASGAAPGVVGGLGIMAAVLAVAGFRAAFKGLRERERNYLTCKLGGLANAVLFVAVLGIYASGFRQ